MSLTDGVLTGTVWPIYIGFGNHPDQVIPQDQRHPITWRDDGNGLITGHANPHLAAGEYTHLLYFHHPANPPTFAAQLSHPYRHEASGRKRIGPILYVGNEITAEV